MTQILVYVTIILLAVTIGYLVRAYELSLALKGKKQHVVTEKDNRVMAKIMLTFLFAFFAYVYFNLVFFGPRLLPDSASEHGVELDWLFNFNMIIIFIVFFITHIVLFWFSFKYYGKKDYKATYYPHNNKLEMIWTVIPAIVLAVIIVYGIKAWNKITAPASRDAIVIQLYAQQFNWTARYAGKDNELGASNYKLITDVNDLGMDPADPKGNDDILVKNEFHIPLGKEVEFKLNAREVIHSAFMPHFRQQMNCVPGMTTMMHLTPIITTAEMRKTPHVLRLVHDINEARVRHGDKPDYVFDYILLCNKICGNNHFDMQMTIVVDTPEDYAKWLATKKPFGAKAEEEKKVTALK